MKGQEVEDFLAEHPDQEQPDFTKISQMRSLKSTWPKRLSKSKSGNYFLTAHQEWVLH